MQVVSSYKSILISWVSRTFFDSVTYKVRHGLNEGLRRKGGLGWLPTERPTPETNFWRSLDLRDKVVYDIGAFHGLLTIFFARQCKQVVAWEPVSRNRSRLEENIAVNGFRNVTVRPCGLAATPGRVEVHFGSSAPGTASIDTSIARGENTEMIDIRVLDDEAGLPAPDMIKIDTEGLELDVLKGGARILASKPALFLEMHGADPDDKRRRVAAIVDHLWNLGYRDVLHIESGSKVQPGTTDTAKEGHLYATAGSSTD